MALAMGNSSRTMSSFDLPSLRHEELKSGRRAGPQKINSLGPIGEVVHRFYSSLSSLDRVLLTAAEVYLEFGRFV